MDSKKTSTVAFKVLKYALAAIACVLLYRGVQSALFAIAPDTRFLTYTLHGVLASLFSIIVFFVLVKFLVYPKQPKGNGTIPRFIVATFVAAIVFVAISWFLQDCIGLGIQLSKNISATIIIILGYFVLEKLVFTGKTSEKRRWALGLRNVLAAAILGACASGLMSLTTSILIMYADYADYSSDNLDAASIVLNDTHEQGRFTVHTPITEAGVADDAPGVTFVWDDSWFFDTPTQYNEELARAGIVLSTVVNSESDAAFNSESRTSKLFDEMGFDTLCTTSYKHHSAIIDNLATMSTGATDTVSFVIGSKELVDPQGNTKELVVIAIRGSYGSEWLSDFNIAGTDIPGYEGDHVGFSGASIVALAALDKELAKYDGENTIVFVCGHSRGGAVTGLVAAQLNKRASTPGNTLPAPEKVFAYGYATPVNTTNADAQSDHYGNIFNILNPSDVVPRLPLEQWGYTRYGVNCTLPRITDADFAADYERMCAFYRESFGMENQSSPEDAINVDRACENLYKALPTEEGVGSLGSLLALGHTFIVDLNAPRVLASHYLPTYISWIFTTSPSDLKIG